MATTIIYTPIVKGKEVYIKQKVELLLLNPKEGKEIYTSDELKEVWQYDHPVYWAMEADESAYTNYRSFEDWTKSMHADTRIVLKYVPFSLVPKPFARIDFKNLTDYDYTICTWENVASYVDLVKDNAYDLDQVGYDIWKERGILPEVTVSVVMMTDPEFNKWFKKNVKP